uniref:4Fe-4S ferredoxin iron-sulfur binding domain protein n=2 Tax=Candidatus Bipolaricaulota TaxID=67810 RepID=H5SJA7_9BACT|nr:4Fe-4S ferredoxin iron-sulfur binding domain protein [uncultured Acetothermia bacterium]BAL59016.1 4Fe-4S ferredoxin iron-sulfur binding domain protein [Candidatus Acetothermum autotrophicum]
MSTLKHGSIAVIGGGIGGIQAALDLADSGLFVYLIEEGPAIGGRMAQLDKTFPTNDCAMCMLSPKLVEVGRHPNVQIITLASVEALEGQPGSFQITVRQRPRYVNITRCIACGRCIASCVYQDAKFPSEFDMGLGKRKPVYIPFPQAVPLATVVDPQTCIFFKSGRCPQNCLKACERGALDFTQTEKLFTLDVGAVVLAPGFEPYDARLVGEYGFGRYANVLTGPQFERLLSASGPTAGKVLRPSDGKAPKKIAFIQCVGSRDLRHQSYCSAVCCMYATKEAIVAKEHDHALEPTIFYIDLRAYGKGFENLVRRARDERGVRYVRSMISQITEMPETKNLVIRYRDESGALREEEFDLVVLAVGMRPSAQGQELARKLGIELNEHGFAKTSPVNPVMSTREGVFVTGAFTGPKDIPETVIQASAAAAAVAAMLAPARGTRTHAKDYPEELVPDGTPRIGVFVCHCGSNIAGVVDVKAVAEYARTLPGVVHAENVLYTCSQDNLKHMKEVIREKKLNRIVVASCTPRNLAALFQDTIREAGLNKFLFEMVNIREQCSWVHSDQPEQATEKAKRLVRMGVAKARELKPLSVQSVRVVPAALVLGGGLSGMVAALTLAESGFETHLVERRAELGYELKEIARSPEGADVQALRAQLIRQVQAHPKICVHTDTTIREISGFVGNFSTVLSGPQGEERIHHGVVIVATEAYEYKPREYLYGEDARVLTQPGFAWTVHRAACGGTANSPDKVWRSLVMIQCVGRNEQRPYCSRICCGEALQNALAFLEHNPDCQIYVLYREMIAYGFLEDLYRRARERGVVFIRYDEQSPPVVRKENDQLIVTVRDARLRQEVLIQPDLVVLSTGVVPDPYNEELSRLLKVPLDAHGFFVEAHIKLRPVDFASHGIFLCGGSHAPGTISELIAKAQAAAGRAAMILAKGQLEAGGVVASVDPEKCTACLTCLRECPFGAVFINAQGLAEIEAVKCQGCGICAADCPAKAIQLGQFEDAQELAMLEELFRERVSV